MNLQDLDKELQMIAAELKRLHKRSPDMLGSDFARDHGWISEADHAADEKQSSKMIAGQEEWMAEIDRLRLKHSELFEQYMSDLLIELRALLQKLENKFPAETRRQTRTAKDASFNIALFPSIITCLDDWWHERATEHWPAWAWRVVFDQLEQARASVADS